MFVSAVYLPLVLLGKTEYENGIVLPSRGEAHAAGELVLSWDYEASHSLLRGIAGLLTVPQRKCAKTFTAC